MKKKLLQTLNGALERTKVTHYAPVTIDALRARLAEELDWLDADPGREGLVCLLMDLAREMRRAGIVVSPGYSFLPDSYLLFLAGVTQVNPVEWDLPFSRFTGSVHNDAVIPFEAGSGCLESARKVLSGRENELVVETAPGLFEVTFVDGEQLKRVRLRITTYALQDSFRRTLKYGWRPLDEAALALFRRGSTDGSIFFESDKMREWLFDFDPESMSDLVLLNAIYHPDRIGLFPEILRRKQDGDYGRELRDTYGVPVYQEQTSDPHLAPKGHYIGRTMMAVEALKAGG
jgi:DNA polymerase III alpha subunit